MTNLVDATIAARAAYEAYGRVTGGRTDDGRLMPSWADLGDRVQAAWRAAATVRGRPHRLASESGPELTVASGTDRMTFRQVGWHGQSGAFYSMDEDPSATEPGSFGPLWIVAHIDRTPGPEGRGW